jgi:aryl-alcohol dehydrogenase-like predicted oxidoreductase
MKERNLGRSGLKVSTLGLGCNNLGGRLDRAASTRVVHAALDLGVTLFDTADVYAMGNRGGSEILLGEALGERRKDIVLATKFGLPMDDERKQRGGSRRYIVNAVEASLTRLKTDWIDLYQLHVPDPETPIEETLRALDDLLSQGKVRYIGCSNFMAWQMVDANLKARQANLTSFVSCQNEYSLLVRHVDRELSDALLAYGVGFLPYFPLASGLLSGKYRRNAALPQGARLTISPKLTDRFLNEGNYELVEKLQDFCDNRGQTLLELAFSWLLARPFVSSVIAGASTPEQLAQNAKAVESTLTAADLGDIDRITDAASLRPIVG